MTDAHSPAHSVPLPAPEVPDKVSLDGLEERWDAAWSEAGTYEFDRSATRKHVYAIEPYWV